MSAGEVSKWVTAAQWLHPPITCNVDSTQAGAVTMRNKGLFSFFSFSELSRGFLKVAYPRVLLSFLLTWLCSSGSVRGAAEDLWGLCRDSGQRHAGPALEHYDPQVFTVLQAQQSKDKVTECAFSHFLIGAKESLFLEGFFFPTITLPHLLT